jgi:hypothetical protein
MIWSNTNLPGVREYRSPITGLVYYCAIGVCSALLESTDSHGKEISTALVPRSGGTDAELLLDVERRICREEAHV